MPHSIFISSVHEDAHLISQLETWAVSNQLGLNVVITRETEDKRYHGYEAIRNYLRQKIEGASAVLVLVGRDTHNHDWIRAEVELANSFNKHIVAVRIADTKGAIPPILNNYDLIEFKPESIQKALNL